MIPIIESNLSELEVLCKRHKVESLSVFGSVVSGNFNDKSDIDLLVNFSQAVELLDYADNYFSFLEKLKILFRREVDLVTEKSIKNPIFRAEIDHTKVRIV